jgi:hypothetical protein
MSQICKILDQMLVGLFQICLKGFWMGISILNAKLRNVTFQIRDGLDRSLAIVNAHEFVSADPTHKNKASSKHECRAEGSDERQMRQY